MRLLRLLQQLWIIIAPACVTFIGIAKADEGKSASEVHDRAAIGEIFELNVLQDNSEAIRRSVEGLSAENRYNALAKWVLPDSHRTAFRLTMEFHGPGTDANSVSAASETQRPSLSAVVGLESPAIDLVRAAANAATLPELRDRIVRFPPGDLMHERCRETLLILVDIESGDLESARQRLTDVLSGLQKLTRTQLAIRCPETLCLFQGIQHAATRDISRESLSFLVDSLIRVERISSNDPWDRAIAAMAGWAQAGNAATVQPANDQSTSRSAQWFPVSRITQRTQGSGFPSAFWSVTRGKATNVTSHDEDYLYFQSPMQGNFEVECDVSGVQWQHSHLMVCGDWIAPVWGGSCVEFGGPQRLLGNDLIDPPLSPFAEWIRYRTVVRDGVRSTWINGRLVQEKNLAHNHDPWLAIRSPWYAEGGVRNLRITGRPEIPESFDLAPQPGLNSWIPGFDAVIGQDWLRVCDAMGDQIVGLKRESQLDGTFHESVLHYHRPMLEDGTIEYEFLYNEDHAHVHPSLDSLTFLLLPYGVRLHRITNGLYDTTDADPAATESEASSRPVSQPLPLKPNSWNHVRLTLSGKIVQIALNGNTVMERALEPTSQRRFGLFHFADQTQASVRNIRWSGSWPRTLPQEPDQNLADPDQSWPELTDVPVFRHDFVKQGVPTELFNSVGFSPGGSSLTSESGGLRMQCPGRKGYTMCFVSPRIFPVGDFDVTAEFDQLQSIADVSFSSGVFLKAIVRSTPVTEGSVFRGLIRNPGLPEHQLTLSEVSSLSSDGTRTSWSRPLSEESSSGRLRLSRRGKLIHCLFAEGDSSQFRLVSAEQVSEVPLIVDGIRLLAMTHESTGSTDVIWKNVEIRATKLSGPAMENRSEVVEELGRLRDQLPASFVHDFTAAGPEPGTFFRWRSTQPWDKSAGGLKIAAPGFANWQSAGINVLRSMSGNFDIAVPFIRLNMSTPTAGKVSGIYVVVQSSDDHHTHATLHFRKQDDGRTVVVTGSGTVLNGKSNLVTIRTMEFGSVSALRIARHQGTLRFLVSSPEFERDQIISTIDFPDTPILSGGVQIHLHTGGLGLESEVVIPRIEIRAEEIMSE